ncbi:MAG: type II toxin-antitoxin system VapC family toxin [Deltaproteobacteria bacterium]|nr:type II toxin-antitoxin system VapC family toxin [Deltaproteobacteria bacterium]MBI3078338.1 type II toxin-antitoxin system VapC family toxin [Deltaproteobacteria bacterium]
MEVKQAKFARELKKFAKVGLDSSILIYHLEDVEPYSDLTEAAFAAIAGGSPGAVLSTISVTELLVQPFAEGQHDRVAALERFVLTLPNTALVPPSYPAAKEAARLRAKYGIRTPDAILVATALGEKAEAFLTNDAHLRRLKAEGIAFVVLDDYI